MDLLFRREQRPGSLARVDFHLWGKLEPDEEETLLLEHYEFRNAILVQVTQPELLQRAITIGVVLGLGCFALFAYFLSIQIGVLLGLPLGAAAAFGYFNEKRETVYVRDLLHGRFFKCDSVVELARKEAWLTTVVSYLRQVLESAKHWDGTEQNRIEPLPKDEARRVILRGL
jgi:hypothetical protein